MTPESSDPSEPTTPPPAVPFDALVELAASRAHERLVRGYRWWTMFALTAAAASIAGAAYYSSAIKSQVETVEQDARKGSVAK